MRTVLKGLWILPTFAMAGASAQANPKGLQGSTTQQKVIHLRRPATGSFHEQVSQNAGKKQTLLVPHYFEVPGGETITILTKDAKAFEKATIANALVRERLKHAASSRHF